MMTDPSTDPDGTPIDPLFTGKVLCTYKGVTYEYLDRICIGGIVHLCNSKGEWGKDIPTKKCSPDT